MKPNTIRNKAREVCAEQAAARQAWRRVLDDHPGADAIKLRNGRLAMLKVLADSGTIEDAEKAAREALS